MQQDSVRIPQCHMVQVKNEASLGGWGWTKNLEAKSAEGKGTNLSLLLVPPKGHTRTGCYGFAFQWKDLTTWGLPLWGASMRVT